MPGRPKRTRRARARRRLHRGRRDVRDRDEARCRRADRTRWDPRGGSRRRSPRRRDRRHHARAHTRGSRDRRRDGRRDHRDIARTRPRLRRRAHWSMHGRADTLLDRDDASVEHRRDRPRCPCRTTARDPARDGRRGCLRARCGRTIEPRRSIRQSSQRSFARFAPRSRMRTGSGRCSRRKAPKRSPRGSRASGSRSSAIRSPRAATDSSSPTTRHSRRCASGSFRCVRWSRRISPKLRACAVFRSTIAPRWRGAAHTLVERDHARGALVTGGHLDAEASDVLYADGKTTTFEGTRLAGGMRGTGCVLAAATAIYLARGENIIDAITAARTLVRDAITNSTLWNGERVWPF